MIKFRSHNSYLESDINFLEWRYFRKIQIFVQCISYKMHFFVQIVYQQDILYALYIQGDSLQRVYTLSGTFRCLNCVLKGHG